MTAILRGREPFPPLATSIDDGIQRFAQLCLSSRIQDRPEVDQIVKFLRSQTDIVKTTKTMLSQLPDTVARISQADLKKCDYHPDGVDVLVAALKCKWVMQGSSEIEVAVKTVRDKVYSDDDINRICDRIRREMYVREKLRHETILALYGMTEGFGVLPSFVYPWMAGGSLHDYVKREYSNLSARRKLDILLEVAHGIEYLHKQDIVHGNLTGDNILLNDLGRVRIADFSHSVILAEVDSQMFSEQFWGDARYSAPESIFTSGRTGAPKSTKEGDVYSYSCVAILILSGKVPYWWILEESQVLLEKEKGILPFHPTVEIDETHLNWVRQCLSAKKSRPSIEKVSYLLLVQSFGAADLTTSVERPNKVYQNTGGFGIVHRCKLDLRDSDAVQQVVFRHQFPSVSTRVDVAVKEILLRSDTDMLTIINRLFREVTPWLKLEHKNIVPLWGVADGFGSLPALVSPWLENGALTGYLEREHEVLSYNKKFALLKDIAEGLQYLHSQSITHGDLSGNNVLVNKGGKASLTDFGLSALLPERKTRALVPIIYGGTASYMAPECLMLGEGNESALVLSPKSDIYSFGGIMLQVLEGKVPYHYIRNHAAIINNISRGIKPKRPPTSVVGDSDWNFVQSCWLEDMESRPSDGEVLEFVEGPAGSTMGVGSTSHPNIERPDSKQYTNRPVPRNRGVDRGPAGSTMGVGSTSNPNFERPKPSLTAGELKRMAARQQFAMNGLRQERQYTQNAGIFMPEEGGQASHYFNDTHHGGTAGADPSYHIPLPIASSRDRDRIPALDQERDGYRSHANIDPSSYNTALSSSATFTLGYPASGNVPLVSYITAAMKLVSFDDIDPYTRPGVPPPIIRPVIAQKLFSLDSGGPSSMSLNRPSHIHDSHARYGGPPPSSSRPIIAQKSASFDSSGFQPSSSREDWTGPSRLPYETRHESSYYQETPKEVPQNRQSSNRLDSQHPSLNITSGSYYYPVQPTNTHNEVSEGEYHQTLNRSWNETQRNELEMRRTQEEETKRKEDEIKRKAMLAKKKEDEVKMREAQAQRRQGLTRHAENSIRGYGVEERRPAQDPALYREVAKQKEDNLRRMEEDRFKGETARATEEENRRGEEERVLWKEEAHLLEDLTKQVQGRPRYPTAFGGFGDIWKCVLVKPNRPIEVVAVKTIRAFQADNEEEVRKKANRLRRELKVWGRLKHGNILPLWGVVNDFGSYYPAMVCPWADHGALTSFLECRQHVLSPLDKFSLLNDIALGLQYLHSESVVHGELTGSNVLIYGNGRACLADFGLSTILVEFIGTSYFTNFIQGNIRWAAAELYEAPDNASLTTECDIYSFGSILLQVSHLNFQPSDLIPFVLALDIDLQGTLLLFEE
ncbi:kinase-like domain-containing protein [Suillus variegatus]|nr:kinase-like domain-containing protein [Suillus variegatus]